MSKGNIAIDLLTGYCVMGDTYEDKGKKYIYNDINPFYGASIEEITKDIGFAKECYVKTRAHFLNTHFHRTKEVLNVPKELKLEENQCLKK